MHARNLQRFCATLAQHEEPTPFRWWQQEIAPPVTPPISRTSNAKPVEKLKEEVKKLANGEALGPNDLCTEFLKVDIHENSVILQWFFRVVAIAVCREVGKERYGHAAQDGPD